MAGSCGHGSSGGKVFRDNCVAGECVGLQPSTNSLCRRLLRLPLCCRHSLCPQLSLPPCLTGDYVKLSSVAVSIVDTPIFQRLRYLKQLGMTGGRGAGRLAWPSWTPFPLSVSPRCAASL